MSNIPVPAPSQAEAFDMLAAALDYTARGMAVFPLHTPRGGRCSCGNAECGKKAGKHPRTRNGLKDATTDAATIEAWWRNWPDANIGMPTGAGNQLFILDVDGPAGEESLRRLCETHGPLPATFSVKSGNGRQLYFTHPEAGLTSRAPVRKDFPGIDSRGDGGYVVAPPSMHYFGLRYAPDPSTPEQVAAAPAWLVEWINAGPRTRPPARAAAANSARIAEGGRNSTLTSEAGRMRRAGMEEAEMCAKLLEVNAKSCDPPLDEDEVRNVARSIARYSPGWFDDARRTFTDTGNAQRFALRHCEDVRYVPEWGKWLIWRGTHWEADTAKSVMELAKEVAASIYGEGLQTNDPSLRSDFAKHAKTSANAARLKAMVDLAASDPRLVISAGELDSHRGVLGVQNGTLDLSSGKLRLARREDYLTMLSPVNFEPGAECPVFVRYLEQTTGGDLELMAYLQCVVGYTLSGYTEAQCLFFLYGTGANGKSTFVGMLHNLLGERLCRNTPSETIVARPGRNGASPELARLPGARVVVTNEVEDGSFLAESLVKQMTGGDMLVARHLYQDLFEFVPQFKLFIVGNHKPIIRNDDYGMWRRIHLVPFLVTIPSQDRDPKLPSKLQTELPGILNWAIAGYQSWRRIGLAPPPAVTQAVEEYREEMDILGQFCEEQCEFGEQYESSAFEVYQSYRFWATGNGLRPWSNASFGRKIKEKFRARRTARGVVYVGFRLGGASTMQGRAGF